LGAVACYLQVILCGRVGNRGGTKAKREKMVKIGGLCPVRGQQPPLAGFWYAGVYFQVNKSLIF
jgi:hypothetical protein